MNKHTRIPSISFIIAGIILFSGTRAQGAGKHKHFVVKLKGNVLYATHNAKNTEALNTTDEPVAKVSVKKKKIVEQPIVSKQEKTTETSTMSNAVPITTNAIASGFDYEQRQINIHTTIFQLYPGTYLDSMSIVNSLLSDSLRDLLAVAKNADSIEYFRDCLSGSLKDSITLAKLSTLSSPDQQVAYVPTGILIAHCKDAASAIIMDSVVMDVFSGSNLVATATSDKDGIILANNVPEGDYYVVFSRKAYEPYSLMQVKVNSASQSYIDIPLVKASGYLTSSLGKNAWLFVITGVAAILGIMIVLAYYLAKYTSKRRFIRARTHGHVTTA